MAAPPGPPAAFGPNTDVDVDPAPDGIVASSVGAVKRAASRASVAARTRYVLGAVTSEEGSIQATTTVPFGATATVGQSWQWPSVCARPNRRPACATATRMGFPLVSTLHAATARPVGLTPTPP